MKDHPNWSMALWMRDAEAQPAAQQDPREFLTELVRRGRADIGDPPIGVGLVAVMIEKLLAQQAATLPIGTITEEIKRACDDFRRSPSTELALERFALRLQRAWGEYHAPEIAILRAAHSFNITDGHNRYRPCPKCSTSLGMGLSSQMTDGKPTLAVECGECSFRGPEIPGVPSRLLDRAAFDAWNAIERRATRAGVLNMAAGAEKLARPLDVHVQIMHLICAHYEGRCQCASSGSRFYCDDKSDLALSIKRLIDEEQGRENAVRQSRQQEPTQR